MAWISISKNNIFVTDRKHFEKGKFLLYWMTWLSLLE